MYVLNNRIIFPQGGNSRNASSLMSGMTFQFQLHKNENEIKNQHANEAKNVVARFQNLVV